MKMPEALRQARLHIFAAKRAIDELEASGDFTLSLTQVSEYLDKTLEWLEEYTETIMGTDEFENAGGSTHWEEKREWDG